MAELQWPKISRLSGSDEEGRMYSENDLIVMRKWLHAYINDVCIWRAKSPEEWTFSKNGKQTSTWQFLLRRGLLDSKFQHFVGILFWNSLAESFRSNPFQLVGPETAASPLVSALSNTAEFFNIECNSLTLRKKRKAYGLHNQFEGIIDYATPGFVVDDFSNSGDTIESARKLLVLEHIPVSKYAFTIVGKGEKLDGSLIPHTGGNTVALQERIKTLSLFNIEEFELSFQRYVQKNGSVNMVPFVLETNGVKNRIWR